MAEPDWRKRAKLTGKGAGASFVGIPHFILDSPAWTALSGSEMRMFFELARQFRGCNNGGFTAGREELAARGWSSHKTIDAAIKGLERAGWVIKTRQGGKYAGCTLYALTIWPIDECGGKLDYAAERKASHLWKQKPAESQAHFLGSGRPKKWAARPANAHKVGTDDEVNRANERSSKNLAA